MKPEDLPGLPKPAAKRAEVGLTTPGTQTVLAKAEARGDLTQLPQPQQVLVPEVHVT